MSIWQNIVDLNPPIDSAVDFPTDTRFHIAVNVRDVEALLPFYRVLFGQEPHTVRDGYAKFELVEPPLNISLNRVVANAAGHGRFGIQIRTAARLEELCDRLRRSGFAVAAEPNGSSGVLQFVVLDPEANRWKLFARDNAN